MRVVVVGNPFDGLMLIGPFDSFDDARDWADRNINDEDWWIPDIVEPYTPPAGKNYSETKEEYSNPHWSKKP